MTTHDRDLVRRMNRFVREHLADNSETPENVLTMLANDNIFAVRAAVASNPKTHIDVLRKLAATNNYDLYLAENPSTPEHSLSPQVFEPNLAKIVM